MTLIHKQYLLERLHCLDTWCSNDSYYFHEVTKNDRATWMEDDRFVIQFIHRAIEDGNFQIGDFLHDCNRVWAHIREVDKC